ncbi:hypothetical protein [Peribacillus asahii]|uniref:hypothetical protein n=1 Tax=Peribacillus asahii TaxID=228899 RepID=UPI0038036189
MKRTCNGCKALEEDMGSCSLGYKIKGVNHPKYIEITIEYKPLEECPKPKTNTEFVKLHLAKS